MEVELNRHSKFLPKTMATQGSQPSAYDPTKSTNSAEAVVAFLEAPWDAPLRDVPGVGQSTEEKLILKDITSQFQLAGVCMTFHGGGKRWQRQMWDFLASCGIAGANRHNIIHAMTEKLAVAFPGVGLAGGEPVGEPPSRELVVTVKGTDFEFKALYAGVLSWPAHVVPLSDAVCADVMLRCQAMLDDEAKIPDVAPELKGILGGAGIAVEAVEARVEVTGAENDAPPGDSDESVDGGFSEDDDPFE